MGLPEVAGNHLIVEVVVHLVLGVVELLVNCVLLVVQVIHMAIDLQE
jgi:hypothetical protein